MYLRRGLGDTASIQALIQQAALKYGVDPSFALAVARQESGFQPGVVSSAGAIGVMQLMPRTAASLGVSDPYDPSQNVDGGVRLLSQLLEKYNGDPTLALAAYNAGPGAVDKYGGVPPYAETQNYVQSILSKLGLGPGSPDTTQETVGDGTESAAPDFTLAYVGLGLLAGGLVLSAI